MSEFVSSFAQMPGGNPYPPLIPIEPVRPLRIFLQAGHRDLDWNAPEYNWLAENLGRYPGRRRKPPGSTVDQARHAGPIA